MPTLNLKQFQDDSPQVYRNPVDLSDELFPGGNPSDKMSPTLTPTTYHSLEIEPSPVKEEDEGNKCGKCITTFSLPKLIYENLIALVISLLVWLMLYTLVESDDLPGGVVFIIVVLEFGGRFAGHLLGLCHLPPMVGMLSLGIIIRNVPYISFGQYLPQTVAAPIRQLSLAVILTRAGLGLDLDVLLKFKWMIARLAFFPTVIEALSVGVMVHFALNFPWLWSFLIGFVIAAVSPAVVVPRLLALKEMGYGVEKGIPTIIIASASLDNIVAIALFGVVMGFIFSTNSSIAITILQGPIEIALGCLSGFLWGTFNGMLFSPSAKKDLDGTVLKTLMVLGGGVISVLGYNRLGYSGAGVLSCLIAAFTTATLWKKRKCVEDFETIRWNFTFLWKFFEPLLFGVIGCQIDISSLERDVVLLGLACLVVGAGIRFITTFLMVTNCGLSLKEKLFFSISYVAKATVQAAIGPMALDLAQKSGNEQDEKLGLQVLQIAVLVILLTAPIGELGVIIFGPRFLSKQTHEDNEEDK